MDNNSQSFNSQTEQSIQGSNDNNNERKVGVQITRRRYNYNI